MPNCAFPGCNRAAASGPPAGTTFGRYCATHRSRQRRHGSAQQRTITQKELAPCESAVKRLVEGFPNARAWPLLDQRWTALVEVARQSTAALGPDALPRNFHEAASRAIMDISKAADARRVWQRVAAFYLLRSRQPGSFTDDRAFAFQIVRSLRKLSASSFTRTRHKATGQVKQWQRDLAPKATEYFGELVTQYLGAAGSYLTDIERKFAEREAQQKKDLGEALAELKEDASH